MFLYIYIISYTEWIPRINVQGVFMKRQREASQKMAELICKNVVDARAMLHYMMRSPSSTGDGRNRQVSALGLPHYNIGDTSGVIDPTSECSGRILGMIIGR
jgi:hypothetical protein